MTDLPPGQSTHGSKWTLRKWHSKRARWGIEVRKRPRLAHSQMRLHLGRCHITLGKEWRGIPR